MTTRLLPIVLVIAATDALIGGQPAPASQRAAEFSITLSAPETTVKAGGPVIVKATVKNISDHPVGIEQDRRRPNYEVVVRDSAGKEARTTAYHRLLRGKPLPDDSPGIINGATVLFTLDPGKTIAESIDLTKLYSLEPGVHSIQVQRSFCIGRCMGTETPLSSNTLTIAVIP